MFNSAEMFDRIEGSFGWSWWTRRSASSAGTGLRSANMAVAAALDWIDESAVELRSNAATAEAPASATTVARANQPSVLMVKGTGGSVEHCRSFGSDPAEQVPGADGGLGIEGGGR